LSKIRGTIRIDDHYEEIVEHASDIEKRLDETYLSKELLKRDNRFSTDGCKKNHLPL